MANVVDADDTMVEWVSDAYPINSGFAEAGVMTLTTQEPNTQGSVPRKGKSRRGKSSSVAATRGSYTPVVVPSEPE